MKESGFNQNFPPQEGKKGENDLVGAVLVFEDSQEGKSTSIRINKIIRTLGKGGDHGDVFEVEVELANDQGVEKKTHRMAIKKYSEWGTNALENLNNSYEHYKDLCKAGIPTWDTYRINKEKKIALMTLSTNEKGSLLTTNDREDNHYGHEQFKKNPFTGIGNIDGFVDEIKSILTKANEKMYRLQPDTWGVIFTPTSKLGIYQLRPIISDLDSLDKSDNPFYKNHYGDVQEIKQAWIRENIKNLEYALFGIFPGTREEKHAWCRLILDKVKSKD